MSKKTKTVQVDSDVTIISSELDVCDALDLIADIMGPIAPAMGSYHTGRAEMGEAVGMISRELTGGALTRNLTRILKCTTVVIKSANLKVDLIDSREKLNQAFAGRQKYLPSAVKLAVEVSLADFLDGLKLIGLKMPTPGQDFGDSTLSTSATG